MSATNLSVPKLHQCLQEELAAMTVLANILKFEELALIDGNIEELSKLTQDKSKLLSDLTKLENERKSCLGQNGYSSDVEGMKNYFANNSSVITTAQDWAKLLQLSEQAKESNRINGILINRQFIRNQSALNILQQNSPAESLYGPNGQSTNNPAAGRRVVIS
jgi:flagellar biosynthesis protein FlgN